MNREMLEMMAPISAPHKTALELFDRIQLVKDIVDTKQMEIIFYCEKQLHKLTDKMNVSQLSKIEAIIDGFDHGGKKFEVVDKVAINGIFEKHKKQVIKDMAKEIKDDPFCSDGEVQSAWATANENWENEASSHLQLIQKKIEEKFKRELTDAEETFLYRLTE